MLIRCKKKKSRDLPSRKILHPATLTCKDKFFKSSFSWRTFSILSSIFTLRKLAQKKKLS